MNLFGIFVCTLFVAEGYAARNVHGMCPAIVVPNGRVRYRQRGKIARFMCNTGYMVAGDRYTVCLGGKWDNTISKCVRASCKIAKPPNNGYIYPSYGGAVLNFYCKGGFELRGANITYCDGLNWDNPLPSCFATNSPRSLSCDFEREDLCGWNHDLNHDFDWKRLNYNTPSGTIGTGPSYDHTKGPGKDGYYMYIESSARRVNDTARLISPVYDKSNKTICFEFYYHMYGATMGSLRVYLKKVNETWNLKPVNAIFSKSGNQGNRWIRGFIILGDMKTDYQIVIEGVRGSSYISDIAIDDVRIINECVPEDEMETTTEESVSSEAPLSVESCENRCNTFDNQTSNMIITCDCDEDCYDRNRCCPDYFDFCVNGTTSDDFTEETSDYVSSTAEITVSKTKTTMLPKTALVPKTTMKPKTTVVPKTTITQKTTVVPKTTIRPKTTILPKSTVIPKTTILPKTTTKPKITITQKTTILLKTIALQTTPAPIKESTPRATLNHDDKEDSNVRPEEDYSDISFTPAIDREIPENPVKETEVINDYDKEKTFGHQKIEVVSSIHESNTKTIIFAVGVVFGVLFAMVGMAFVARRYQLCNCRRMRLNQSSNGDSQSDVRFLTSDEILDFSLATDYDTL